MAQNESPRNNGKTQLQMFMESISTITSQKTRKTLYAFIHVMRKHNLLKQYLKYYFEYGKGLGNVEFLFSPTMTEIINKTIDPLRLKCGLFNGNVNQEDLIRFNKRASQDSFYKDSRNALYIIIKQHYIHMEPKNLYWSNPSDWYVPRYQYDGVHGKTWC